MEIISALALLVGFAYLQARFSTKESYDGA